MFQFRWFPTYTYVFSIRYIDSTLCEFPHSDICGSKIICISPQLFAAYHVFLRFSVPRHSPCALFSLTIFSQIIKNFTSSFFSLEFYIPNRILQNCRFFNLLKIFKTLMSSLSFVSFLLYYLVFKVQFLFQNFFTFGGLKWTRTTDLTLIRRAL